MSFWTEIHWSEGMFLRPHQLQAAHRHTETSLNASFEAARPFGWGFMRVEIAPEPLENFTLRLDECLVRMKDGTWLNIPENADASPLEFKKKLEAAEGGLDVFLGIPRIRTQSANSVPLEDPSQISGSERFDPTPIVRRDENTGENKQTIYVRRIRASLFTAGDDMSGYETVRLGRVIRSDRPGAVPDLDPIGVGPLLTIQASPTISRLVTSLHDQVEGKGDRLAWQACEHQMTFADGVPTNTEYLLKLHIVNEIRGQMQALKQSPQLHPFDVFVLYAQLIGKLSVFTEECKPGPIPKYDHDRPGVSLERLRELVEELLGVMDPTAYVERRFNRKRDARGHEGLEVGLERSWVDENLEMYIGLTSSEMDVNEVHRHMTQLGLKLASPTTAPRIANIAVKGLDMQPKIVPAGLLPRRPELHYFRLGKAPDQTTGDRRDYWRECEQERGIRVSIQEGRLQEFEKFRPTLYVVLRARK